MADQDFELTAKLRIRAVTANDAKDLQTYCFTTSTVEEIGNQLKDDLARNKKGEVYRLVVEASNHAIGNIRVERHKLDNALGELSQLAVCTPFRAFQVADKLVAVAEQVAQENGIETLQIELPKSDGGIIEAYKKWGFAERPVVTLQKQVGQSTPEETPVATATPPPERPKAPGDEGKQQELL